MKCTPCFFSDAALRSGSLRSTSTRLTDESCRRCSRNFTRRELLDVLLFGLVYLVVCRFSHYLFTGDFFSDPLGGGILSPLGFGEVFTFPVNFGEHPIHVFTVGWTFALVLMIPMLVAVFYGVAAGGVVALVGSYHVAVPFFFVPVCLGALMAGTRLARRVRLETALLLATLPSIVYLVVLSLGALRSIGVGAWACLPWLVTGLLSVVSISPVLWLARRWEYRMRPLLWVMGVPVVIVVVVFHTAVGFSKVEYEFVRREYWTGGARFRIVVPAGEEGLGLEEQREKARALYRSRRLRSVKGLSRFISWFPRSPETPLALFERAEAWNLRCRFTGPAVVPRIGTMAESATRPDPAVVAKATMAESAVLTVYTGPITPEALADYSRIRTDFAPFPAAIESRLRIARYYLQTQDLQEAVRELRDLVDFCDVKVPRNYRPADTRSVLLRWRTHRLSDEERLQLLYEVLEAARLELRFLQQNSDYNHIPLMLFYQLDEHGDDYALELGKILKWFPDCRLADNVKLILLERRAYEPEELKSLLETYPDGDAAPRMLFLLGTGYRDRQMYAPAEEFLRRLTVTFPESPEAARATVLLKNLKVEPDKR